MSQKSGNNVKPPTSGEDGAAPQRDQKGTVDEQHHGENTKSVQDDRKIGQNNAAGRPPLMKK